MTQSIASGSQAPRTTVRAKEHRFPLGVDWVEGRRVAVRVDGKPDVEAAPPPVFGGIHPETWSPEDFLVAAAASCLAVTFTGLAARAGVSFTSLHVDGDGVVGLRPDGRYGFTRLLLHLEVAAPGAYAQQVHHLAEQAEARCLVAASLDLPVETTIDVLPAAA